MFYAKNSMGYLNAIAPSTVLGRCPKCHKLYRADLEVHILSGGGLDEAPLCPDCQVDEWRQTGGV